MRSSTQNHQPQKLGISSSLSFNNLLKTFKPRDIVGPRYIAFPILSVIFTYYLWIVMGRNGAGDELQATLAAGEYADGTPISASYTGIRSLDQLVAIIVAFEYPVTTGQHQPSWLLMLDIIPVLWCFAVNVVGAAVILPLYFWIQLRYQPAEHYINLWDAAPLPAAFLIGGILPGLALVTATVLPRSTLTQQQIIALNQLQVVWKLLDKDIDPFYLDGETEAPKANGLSAFTKGPFYCYHDAFDPTSVKKAHEMLSEVIEEEGPFDGIVGFSQGASLAVAYLLQHEIDHPNEPAPFKFAALFSSIISFTPDERYCDNILQNMTEEDLKALATFPDADFSVLSPDARTLFEAMAEALSAGQGGGFLAAHPDKDVFLRGETSRIPRIIHPDLVKQRVGIPTIHVVGRQDDPLMIRQSELMYRLCDPTVSKWVEHSAGHDVPRQVQDAKAAVTALEWAISEGQEQVWARL
ncbi:hypothetical protein DV735_g2939, partial [Chaetothyriales sp. CBS 134920]